MSAIISLLIRAAPYLIFTGVILWIGHSVFQSGVDREHNRIVAQQYEADIKLQEKEKQLREEVRKLQETQRLTITEVQNDHAKEINQLNDTVRKLRNRGLYVDSTTCENKRLPESGEGKTTGQSVPGIGQGKIRLPEQIESDLWEQASDAGEVVALYKACRTILLSPVCNIELVD